MWHLVTQPRTPTRLPRGRAEARAPRSPELGAGPLEGAGAVSTRAWGPRFLTGALCLRREERLFLPFFKQKMKRLLNV